MKYKISVNKISTDGVEYISK